MPTQLATRTYLSISNGSQKKVKYKLQNRCFVDTLLELYLYIFQSICPSLLPKEEDGPSHRGQAAGEHEDLPEVAALPLALSLQLHI